MGVKKSFLDLDCAYGDSDVTVMYHRNTIAL